MRAKNRSPRPTKSDWLHQQRRFYVPNDLFFSPASDQYFTKWSLFYLQEIFIRTHG